MHLVHQHTIEVNCDDQKFGKIINDDLKELLLIQFYPKLEKLLSNYDYNDEILSIDRIPVMLNKLNSGHWKTDFLEQSLLQIESYLRNQPQLVRKSSLSNSSIPTDKRVLKKDYALKLFLQFLETGTLESNVLTNDFEELISFLEADRKFVQQLIQKLKGNILSILRWSLNIPEDLRSKVLSIDGIVQNIKFEVKELEENPRIKDFNEFLFWVYYFNEYSFFAQKQWVSQITAVAFKYYGLENSIAKELCINHIKQINSLFKGDPTKETDDIHDEIKEVRENKITNSHAVQYVENAGLVLLHPFLPKFFNDLGFLFKGQWTDEKTKHRACLLLQYMVGFNELYYENELVLNKLLCGIPISETLQTRIDFSSEEKERCRELLQAIIIHWKILKNTSVEGLQESFIQRSGKIIFDKNEHLEINVEYKSYDILLDQLPWSISMIKCPWMDNLLICNWNR